MKDVITVNICNRRSFTTLRKLEEINILQQHLSVLLFLSWQKYIKSLSTLRTSPLVILILRPCSTGKWYGDEVENSYNVETVVF
jgi:hypothetical protein